MKSAPRVYVRTSPQLCDAAPVMVREQNTRLVSTCQRPNPKKGAVCSSRGGRLSDMALWRVPRRSPPTSTPTLLARDMVNAYCTTGISWSVEFHNSRILTTATCMILDDIQESTRMNFEDQNTQKGTTRRPLPLLLSLLCPSSMRELSNVSVLHPPAQCIHICKCTRHGLTGYEE